MRIAAHSIRGGVCADGVPNQPDNLGMFSRFMLKASNTRLVSRSSIMGSGYQI